MSQVILNRGNVDVTELQVEQAGSASCEVITEAPLLDSTKDYVMGCTSCVVPLTEEPMITYDVNNALLFTVRRRKHGVAANTAADALALAGDVQNCQLVPGYKIFSVTDLVTFIANWSTRFSNAVADRGLSADGAGNTINVNEAIAANHASIDRRANNLQGTRLLGVSLTPGGVLQITGSAPFWNNFYIQTTAYCRELLGFSYAALTISWVVATNTYSNTLASLLAPDGTIAVIPVASRILLANTHNTINADYSIFRKTEERMRISMEVALSVPMNISIVNGVERRTHTIFSAPLQSDIKSTLRSDDGVIEDTTELTLRAFQGRVHLLKKSNGNVQWYPLTSSYAIQNSRVEIYVTRRRFHSATSRWYTDRKPLAVDPDSVWSASLKFVSVF